MTEITPTRQDARHVSSSVLLWLALVVLVASTAVLGYSSLVGSSF